MASITGSSLVINGPATVTGSPSLADHVIRKADLDAAISGVAGGHAAVTISSGNGASVALTLSGQELDAALVVKNSGLAAGEGEIGVGLNGHFVKLGTVAGTAAAGDHTHANATTSVAGMMSGADKAKLDALPTAFLELGATGSTAAAGNHTHSAATTSVAGFLSAADKTKLDAVPSAFFALSTFLASFRNTDSAVYNADATTMGIDVRRKVAPGAGEGSIGVDVNGIFVNLGTTATTAAAGNHTHSAATTSVAGFLSAADKAKLDALPTAFLALGATSTTAAAGNHTHANATTSVAGFMSAADKSKVDALPSTFLVLGATGTTAAAGNHTHSAATTSVAGFLSAADKAKLDALPTTFLALGSTSTTASAGNHTHSAATTSVAGFLSAADKAKLDALPTAFLALGTTSTTAAAGNHTHANATISVAGFMSAADKAKVDGIPSSGYAAADHSHANATTSAAGFMSTADKAKIDAIPSEYLSKVDNTQIDLTLSGTVLSDAKSKVHASFYLSITGGTSPTMGAPSNMVNGGFYTWTLVRDGSQTVTFDPVFKWGSGSAPVFGADNALVVMGVYSQGVLRCQGWTNFA